ncbi:MAG: GHKL domain-containing protein [Lachnospiraceae bacterium]|nr:GHKL domain-containing protein [Lachnospiraceae bacterium]
MIKLFSYAAFYICVMHLNYRGRCKEILGFLALCFAVFLPLQYAPEQLQITLSSFALPMLFPLLCNSKHRFHYLFLAIPVELLLSLCVSMAKDLLLLFHVPAAAFVEPSLLSTICKLVTPTILWMIYACKKDFFAFIYRLRLSMGQYISICLTLVAAITLLVLVNYLISRTRLLSHLQMVLFQFCLYLLVLAFVFTLLFQSYLRQQNAHLEHQAARNRLILAAQQKHFDDLIDKDQQMRKFRHDMRAHFLALSAYADKLHDPDLSNYLSGIWDHFQEALPQNYTGNSAVDAIICDLHKSMMENQIPFTYENTSGGIPRTLDSYDLCGIFYNALSNAIEESLRLPKEARSISMALSICNGHLQLTFQNACRSGLSADTINDIPLPTSKSDTLNHGFGIQNMRDITTKYNGVLGISIQGTQFLLTIVL